MSNSKYCENCGAKNSDNAIFCTNCQNAFDANQQSGQGNFSSLGNFQQVNQEATITVEPRTWRGGNLGNGITAIYSSPDKATPELLEDPNAPSPIILVIIAAILTAITTYLVTSKVTYVNVNVDSQFEDNYTSDAVIQQAQIAAVIAALFIFAIWWIGSWILALLVRGGLPDNSVVKYNATPSMRKLNGYRYVPAIVISVIQIILLSFEDNRTADVKMGKSLGVDAPVVDYTSNYSDFYTLITPVLSILAAVISAYILFAGIKKGLNHQGSAPAIIAVLIALWPVIVFFGYSPI
ncbi:MAG: zinc ribbon domain-containing protein [Candidatus Kariarchaeaceae archaeon]|jgi:hypothetical protein